MKRLFGLALISAFSLVLVASAALAQDIFEREKGLFETDNISASAQLGTQNKLVIVSAESLSGTLTVTTAKARQISVRYTKSAKTMSRSQAIDYIDLITVSLDKQGDMIRLEMRAPNPAPWHEASEAGMVHAQLVVPEKCNLEINAGRFAIDASGPLASIVVPSSLEKISVRRVDGVVDISTANQPIMLVDARGDINVVTTNAPITATNIGAKDTPAKFRNDGGEISIDRMAGPVNVRGDYGRIDIRQFTPSGGNSVIRGTGAPVMLQIDSMTDGQLVISNSDEDIDLTVPDNISAFFSLSVDSDGSIEARGMPFKPDLVKPDRLNIRTGDNDVNIRSSVSGKGSIFVRGIHGD